MRVQEKVEEAGLAAGIHGSNIAVVDQARQPVKPVAPDLPLYMAITFFVGLWLAVGAALLMDSIQQAYGAHGGDGGVGVAGGWSGARAGAYAKHIGTADGRGSHWAVAGDAQPTRIRRTRRRCGIRRGLRARPGCRARRNRRSPMAAPIGPGDELEISEYHTPEFRSAVRVSATGTVMLPMIGEVKLSGLDEQAAAHAIEAALVAKGMLLHPLVSVLVTAYVGQDVSVLGEVARPGVYPYTAHHRLLDLISAASGLAPSAGRLVNIFHRNDPETPHAVVLDPNGTRYESETTIPELNPGDTVQVSRAGLVYVVGDVIRPGGFPVDPVQGLTVVQALSLAWGPTQNAATGKGLLIREQKGGRTLTALNLKRLLRGQDPDMPVEDGDILFVPDSMAKNLCEPDDGVGDSVGDRSDDLLRPGLFAEVLGDEKSLPGDCCWLFAFAIPWEYSLDLGEPLGNVARIAGLVLLLVAIPAVLQAGRVRTPGPLQWMVLALYLWFCCSYFWTIDAGGDAGQDARLLPGDDDRLAGVGVCREPARFALAAAGVCGRLVGAGGAYAGKFWFGGGDSGGADPICGITGRIQTMWRAFWIWGFRWRRCF